MASPTATPRYVRFFRDLSMEDVAVVGGKNASLGEMVRELSAKGVQVPDGFATTAEAFRLFLSEAKLNKRIADALANLDVADTKALRRTGEAIRGWITDAPLPEALAAEVAAAYRQLSAADADKASKKGHDVSPSRQITVAVRSSATAEDLPDASFAGQQETYLNVEGEEALLRTVRRVFASLYTNRAISYRAHHGFSEAAVALSAGVQKMVRSDVGASGVIFTLDTESGFPDVCMVTGAWGLGETVVQGSVNPDEWLVFKPVLCAGGGAVPIVRRHLGSKAIKRVYRSRELATTASDATVDTAVDREQRERFCLSDEEVLSLARCGVTIERHYSAKAGGVWRPMDIEWAKDGLTGELYIVQARPETVHSVRKRRGAVVQTFELPRKARAAARVLTVGRAVGAMIGAGRVRVIEDAARMGELQDGEVLVTDMTDPDWEPVLKRAAAIVTNRGGRTCHAAIVAREIGIPAVVGAGNATRALSDGQEVTVSCAEGEEGFVLEGLLPFTKRETDMRAVKQPRNTRISIITGNPDEAFALASLPVHGVGLARLEFIISRIGLHPQACLDYEQMPAADKDRMRQMTLGAASPAEFYVQRIAEGVATIAAAFYPNPVIVRMSDFKTNEYRRLLGGEQYEPKEENPMLGFRGASRYYSPSFAKAFGLECQAMARARDVLGLRNIELMVPFVRTEDELRKVLDVMAQHGLRRGDGAGAAGEDAAVAAAANGGAGGGGGLRVHMMCEVPSNALLADRFLALCDGFSIGSNDLTQLCLGLDRDSGALANNGCDERNDAVKALMGMAIDAANKAGKYVGICGQAPSDFPDLAAWLVKRGIRALSLNPDSVLATLQTVAQAEEAGAAAAAREE